jgi:pantothenate kinase
MIPSESSDMTPTVSFSDLVERARALADSGRRHILGITGAPGAGKTTLASALTDALWGDAVLVTMDGFHLANTVLHQHGSRDRKGAPDTFDVGGYIALLQRLRDQREEVVYAPEFDRAADASIGSAVPVSRATALVITEGNYLLLERDGWAAVRPLLDEAWFIAPPEDVRQHRLIRRHERFGLTTEQARDWALGTDERNARLVAATHAAADLVACVTDIPLGPGAGFDAHPAKQQ